MAAMSLNLPPGFRFRPTELEIINHYLRLKITGNDKEAIRFIAEVNFLKWEPWELPGLSGIETTDQEWFYFSQLVKKHPNGKQKDRTTNSGFWKVTCGDKEIWSGGRLIGKRTSLVFYLGNTENSKKTDWKMSEYHTSDTTLEELDGTKLPGQKPLKYVFCHLVHKQKQDSGKAGPANGKLAEDHPITSNECLHPENSDGMAYDTRATGIAKSASESPDKGCKGRKRKCSTKAGPAKSKRSAASESPATGEFLHSENSDTIPSVECSNSNSSAENQVAEMKQVIADEVDLQPETSLASLSDTAAVSSPITAKSPPDEAESDLSKALVSPASVQAEEYPTIDGTTSDIRAPVECGDNNFEAYSAETQMTDEEVLNALLDMLQDPPDCTPSLPNTPTASPPTAKSSLEKEESEPALASVSPALGEEAGNHLTGCYSDGMTSSTVAPTTCNHNSQGAEATAGNQVGDSNMCCAPPELPEPDKDFWNSSFFSPLPWKMQNVLDAICMSDLVANGDESKLYFHDVVPSQYGTNDLTTYNSELWGPMPNNNPDGSLGNDPSSQKKLAFDCETIKNMESVMDDGSRSAVNAKMLNGLKFDPPVQDSMWSVEINRGDVSSGFLNPGTNDGCTFSIRSI